MGDQKQRRALKINVSEIASLIGWNPWVESNDAKLKVLERNGISTDEVFEYAMEERRVVEAADALLSKTEVEAETKTRATGHEAIENVLTKATIKQQEQQKQRDTHAAKLDAAVQNATAAMEAATTADAKQAAVVIKAQAEAAVVMHREQVEQADKAAAKARDKLRERTACSYGTHAEKRDMTNFWWLERQKWQQMELCTTAGNVYQLRGILDGWDAGESKVYEFKNRMRRLFGKIPHYEVPQIQAYMHMTGAKHAAQVESYRGQQNVHEVAYDPDTWEEIRWLLDEAVDDMFRKL